MNCVFKMKFLNPDANIAYNFTNYSKVNDRSRCGLHSKLGLHICISPAVEDALACHIS